MHVVSTADWRESAMKHRKVSIKPVFIKVKFKKDV